MTVNHFDRLEERIAALEAKTSTPVFAALELLVRNASDPDVTRGDLLAELLDGKLPDGERMAREVGFLSGERDALSQRVEKQAGQLAAQLLEIDRLTAQLAERDAEIATLRNAVAEAAAQIDPRVVAQG